VTSVRNSNTIDTFKLENMATIPHIHICHALTSENEVLKSKYDNLKRKYKKLHKEMLDLKESMMRVQMEKEYASRNDKSDAIVAHPLNGDVSVKNVVAKKDTTEKLLVLNNQLIKQFEKGNKQIKNSERKVIKTENEKEKLQNDLFEANQQITFLKKQIEDKDNRFQLLHGKMKAASRSKQDYSGQVAHMNKEKKKLVSENAKLKAEIKGLDESFFEEIEDMKYALQQSAKLNTEYERALRRLCKQYGLNYNSALFSSQKDQQNSAGRRTR